MQDKKIHQGRNVKRFREMLGIKQDVFAHELGDDWSQKKVSLLEQKETIETDILEQVAKILKVPAEAIQNFDEEQAINIISNHITNNDNAVMHGPALYNHYPTFNINPMEKWIESIEENKKLYERLIQQQKEMIEKLERLIEGK